MSAPDYAAPIVGWRGWFVVESEGAFRLCSIIHHTHWPPRQELVASCRSNEHRSKPEVPAGHAAPEAACRCGIYACESAAAATPFLSGSRTPARQTLGFVLGRVSLWGKVVSANAAGAASAPTRPASTFLGSAEKDACRSRAALARKRSRSHSAATACRSSRSPASRWPSSRASSGARIRKHEHAPGEREALAGRRRERPDQEPAPTQPAYAPSALAARS